MTTITKDKPKGFTKYLFAFDTETTGLTFGNLFNPDKDHQIVSIGIIIVDSETLKNVDELYLEIKWNDQSKNNRKHNSDFGRRAEEIHGLTFEYLEINGITEEEAVTQIVNLIMKYWGPTVSIKALGHNVHMFDIPFLHSLCNRHNILLNWGTRHVCTFGLSNITFGSWNSDDMFNTIGLTHRETHNALDDIASTLDVVRAIRLLWDSNVGLKSYD